MPENDAGVQPIFHPRYTPPVPFRRLICDRVVLEVEGELRVQPAQVDIEGTSIVAVGPIDSDGIDGNPPPGTTVEHLGNKLLAPAFVNPHTHLALVALRGAEVANAARANRVEALFFDFERKLSADDVRAFARVGALESLLAGVGLVWDHYYFGDAVADALADTGVCGVVAPTLQDLAGPGVGRFDQALDTTLALHRSAPRKAQGVFAALGPHATDTVSGPAWARIVDMAEAHQLPVHMHVAQSPEEVERVVAREGWDPVTWLERLGVYERAPSSLSVHGIFSPVGPLARLPPKHAAVVCPRAQAIFGLMARVDRWQQAGVEWLVASDAAASNDAMDVRAELSALSALRSTPAAHGEAMQRLLAGAALPPGEVSAAAQAVWTQRGQAWRDFDIASDAAALLDKVWGQAGAMHPEFVCGRIQAGALANLCVWDLEHPSLWPGRAPLHGLVHGQVSGALHNVMTLGEWRGEGGDFARSVLASPLWRDARAEADGRLAALLD